MVKLLEVSFKVQPRYYRFRSLNDLLTIVVNFADRDRGDRAANIFDICKTLLSVACVARVLDAVDGEVKES
jgi:hypothetical protein